MNWTRADARALCVAIEKICPLYGCHVALTGGCLYGDAFRPTSGMKDCDILFYRIRQRKIDAPKLFKALHGELGITLDCPDKKAIWCVKAKDGLGRRIDMFFPENPGDYYAE